MEFRIKYADQFDPAICDYGGYEESILIKLVDTMGNETGWIGKQTVMKAMQVLQNADNSTVQPAGNMSLRFPKLSADDVPQIPGTETQFIDAIPTVNRNQRPAPKKEIDPRTKAIMDSLGVRCKKLLSEDNEGAGVSEVSIYGLLSDYRGLVPDLDVLYPVFRHYFGMERKRFDVLKHRSIIELPVDQSD